MKCAYNGRKAQKKVFKRVGKENLTIISKSRLDCAIFLFRENEKGGGRGEKIYEERWREHKGRCEKEGETVEQAVYSS